MNLARGVAMYGLGNPTVAGPVSEAMGRIPVELTRTYLDLRQIWANRDAPDWADTDARLSAIERFGCKVLLHTQYMPRWLSQCPNKTGRVRSGAAYVPAWALYPPKDIKLYRAMLSNTFNRIAAKFPGVPWGLEVGNEPDRAEFLRTVAPETPMQAYLKMYDAHIGAATNLTDRVGGPAVSGSAASMDWIKMLVQQSFRLDFCSAHYYGQRPDRLFAALTQARSLLDSMSYGRTQMVLSEWGFDGTGASTLTETDLGADLARQLLTVMETCGLDAAIWFYDRDQDAQHHFGLLRPDCSPKPIYEVFRTWGKSA